MAVADIFKAITDHEGSSTHTPSPSTSLALQTFQLAATKTFKAYIDVKAGQREASCLHGSVEQQLKEVSKLLSHVRKKEPEKLQYLPELASSFSLLLRAAPCLATSKSLKIANFLCDHFCSDLSFQSAVNHQSDLLTVLDCLSLPSVFTRERGTLEGLTLTNSWARLFSLFKHSLDPIGPEEVSRLLAAHYSKGLMSSGRGQVVTCGEKMTMVSQVSEVMTPPLVAADREQTAAIFQQLLEEDCGTVTSASVLCYSWNIILSARLSQDSQRELRRWQMKILLQCEATAILHKRSAPVISMTLQLTTRLVALPTRVGLDSRLV